MAFINLSSKVKKAQEELEEIKREQGFVKKEKRKGGVITVPIEPGDRYHNWRRRSLYAIKKADKEQGNHPYGYLITPGPAPDFDTWFRQMKQMQKGEHDENTVQAEDEDRSNKANDRVRKQLKPLPSRVTR